MREIYYLPARCEMRVTTLANSLDRNAILEQNEFVDRFGVPLALVSCKGGIATTVIQNCKEEGQSLVVAPF